MSHSQSGTAETLEAEDVMYSMTTMHNTNQSTTTIVLHVNCQKKVNLIILSYVEKKKRKKSQPTNSQLPLNLEVIQDQPHNCDSATNIFPH